MSEALVPALEVRHRTARRLLRLAVLVHLLREVQHHLEDDETLDDDPIAQLHTRLPQLGLPLLQRQSLEVVRVRPKDVEHRRRLDESRRRHLEHEIDRAEVVVVA